MPSPTKLKKQRRSLTGTFVRSEAEGENDLLEFSFSSEEPVTRWFGEEVLSHEKSAADFSRLNDGANLLWNHNSDAVIGVLEKAWIGTDKRAHAKIRWGTSPKAQEIRADVEAGVIRNVSFGYQIKEMEQTNPGAKGAEPKFLATKWMPYEVSFVSIPADQTVGMGRAESGEESEVTIINKVQLGDRKMNEEEKKAFELAQKEAVAKAAADARTAERVRTGSINALCEKHGMPADFARSLIDGDKSIDEARAAVLEKMGVKQVPVTGNEGVVGLTEKEVKRFSFVNILRAQMNPNERKYEEAVAFEREVSNAAQKTTGKMARGFMIPTDILRSKRDLTVGSASAGGNMVDTELLAGSFIELLRNKSILQRAGATVMNGLVGSIAIPRQSGGATAYWVAESGAPTESQQAVDQVAMSPKTVGAYTDFSRKLMLQSSIDVENFVRSDLAAVIALAIDKAGLYGSGMSNQPTGLFYTSGINTVDFTAAAPTWLEILDMEAQIALDNADIGNIRHLTNAKGRQHLKGTDKFSSAGQPIWESNNTVNGYAAEVSNQILTLSSTDPDHFLGNFADLLMGFWSGLDLLVDPFTASTSGTMRVVALQDVDVAVRHAESFCYGNKTIS